MTMLTKKHSNHALKDEGDGDEGAAAQVHGCTGLCFR